MLGVSPYIAFAGNCREAISFYEGALDAKVIFLQTMGESPMCDMGPADSIMHATIQIGSSQIMMCDDPRPNAAAGGGNMSLAIGLNDLELARKYFDNLAKDGTVVMPLDKTFWAVAFGMVTDRFGIKWMVNCDAPR